MDDKERLEEIKGRYMEFEYDFNLRKEDIEWLIEQAGRVQELERQASRHKERIIQCALRKEQQKQTLSRNNRALEGESDA